MEPRTVLLAKKFVRAIVIMLEKNKIPGFTGACLRGCEVRWSPNSA